MAEQYILNNTKSKTIKAFIKNVKCTVTPLFHTNVGWNQNSRNAYDGMMGLNAQPAIVGRNSLPPHFYIEIPAGTDTLGVFKDSGDFARNLSRSAVPTVLKGLTDGDAKWNEGRKADSLIAEIARGNVSISIYHLDGKEVGTAERDIVDAYPKKT